MTELEPRKISEQSSAETQTGTVKSKKESTATPSSNSGFIGWAMIAAATAVLGAGSYWLQSSATPQSAITASPQLINSDRMTVAERIKREASFTEVATEGVELSALPNTPESLASLFLEHEALADISAQIEAGQTVLKSFSVYDDASEDGDVVSININGYTRTVPLRRVPTNITVPVSTSGQNAVTITGVKDGGGGVTLGIRYADGTLLSPNLAVGQSTSVRLK